MIRGTLNEFEAAQVEDDMAQAVLGKTQIEGVAECLPLSPSDRPS